MRHLPTSQNPENFTKNIQKVWKTLDAAHNLLSNMIAGLETIGIDEGRLEMIEDSKKLLAIRNQLQGVSQQVAEQSAEYFLRPSK